MTRFRTPVIVCPACDLAHRRADVAPRAHARCVRCRAELYRGGSASLDRAVALALTAVVLFALSNAYPLVQLELGGAIRRTTLLGAAQGLYVQGYAPIAALVLSTTVLVPAFQLASLLYVLVPLRRGRRVAGSRELFRVLARLRPWAMPEVFMLGAIVALVKLAAMAQVVPGIALIAYGMLMLILSSLATLTSTGQLWRWVEGSHP